ncbi:MAG: hypothetical protein E2O51_07515 [Gammaproteobacteria bacterium]|nr:MAG: hypothetical protein E2O51_07515 [Gammaproteobacteria bacterium]
MDMVRTIHLELAEHPQNITSSTEGHSPNTIIPIQEIMHSAQMHVVERYRYDSEGQRLFRSYIVEDPLYFVSTYANEDMMGISAKPWESYGCLEFAGDNNRRLEDR